MPFINTKYFKERLLKEKERVLKNIEEINADLARIASEDEINDLEDMAELEIENERDKDADLARIASEDEINEKIRKIDEGRYGFDNKGNPISLLKLLKNPLLG